MCLPIRHLSMKSTSTKLLLLHMNLMFPLIRHQSMKSLSTRNLLLHIGSLSTRLLPLHMRPMCLPIRHQNMKNPNMKNLNTKLLSLHLLMKHQHMILHISQHMLSHTRSLDTTLMPQSTSLPIMSPIPTTKDTSLPMHHHNTTIMLQLQSMPINNTMLMLPTIILHIQPPPTTHMLRFTNLPTRHPFTDLRPLLLTTRISDMVILLSPNTIPIVQSMLSTPTTPHRPFTCPPSMPLRRRPRPILLLPQLRRPTPPKQRLPLSMRRQQLPTMVDSRRSICSCFDHCKIM